ncbi:MAG: hypothetical protein JWM43_4241 [Acidobacteriaceae bacterium]|nr:hypothetical protein [Acidobacteriaceae bacterium]
MTAAHYVEGDELRDKLWLQVRTVLMEEWDPIGVCSEPNATNEYDSYIPKVMAILRSESGVEALMDYLDWVATARMGFTSQRERSRFAAESLCKLAK